MTDVVYLVSFLYIFLLLIRVKWPAVSQLFFLLQHFKGFVIAFVSEFVPRLYFKWSKGKDGDLEGYLDTSLSCFDTRNFPNDEKTKTNFTPNYLSNGCGLQLPSCRWVFLFIEFHDYFYHYYSSASHSHASHPQLYAVHAHILLHVPPPLALPLTSRELKT